MWWDHLQRSPFAPLTEKDLTSGSQQYNEGHHGFIIINQQGQWHFVPGEISLKKTSP